MKRKKCTLPLLSLCTALSLSLASCLGTTTTKTETTDYQYIFDIVKDLDRVSTVRVTEDMVFNYGEYCYNSFLLLVPRKTPSTITSFYFRWQQWIDVDDLGFSFECKLGKDAFESFINGLDSFCVTIGDDINQCLRIEDRFDYPVYIVQWLIPNKKWNVFEYIMVDYPNNAVMYVYSLCGCFKYVKDNVNYNIAPNVNDDMVLGDCGNVEDGFSVYMKPGTRTEYYHYPPKLSDLLYDASFLNYLS